MVSWLEELERREARARERISELRGQIGELTARLAEQEAAVSRLEITRETMTEILSGDGPVTGPDGTAESQEPGGAASVPDAERFGVGSPVGVRLVPSWSEQLGVEALPRAYADIVEVLADAVHPLRAHQLCSVLGLSTDKSKVEGFRSKLKRLRERGWIAEVSPGLFASRDAAGPGRAPVRGNDSALLRHAGDGEGSRSWRRGWRNHPTPRIESPMEEYEHAALADPFAAAVSCFTQLVADLSGPGILTAHHHEVEEMAAERGRELARLLLQGHLDLCASREETELSHRDAAERAVLADGRTRLEKGHHRELATVVGSVRVSRCALRAPGRANCYPADAALSLPRERHSLGIRRLAVLEAVRGSYDTALEAITRRCGKVVDKRQVEHLVQAAAVDVAAFYAARIPQPASAGVLLVLSVDGKGIVMRPGHLREATRKAAERAKRTTRTRLATGEKAGRKRMATLAAVYDAAPSVRRPHDIIAPPGGRSDQRTPRPGPKAQAKWLTGSVEHDPQQVIAAAFDQAQARDPQHPASLRDQRPGENEGMFCLQAVIATESVLRELAGSTTEACIVPLSQHLWLLPMTDALFDALTVAGAPELDRFWKAPAGFERQLTACSEAEPVAYIEADYFGGAGTQTAQVWDAGKVVLGPLCLAEGEPSPTTGTPISQALRRLGTAKGNHVDEFAAVGLGRHRDTDDWLSPRNRSRPVEPTT